MDKHMTVQEAIAALEQMQAQLATIIETLKQQEFAVGDIVEHPKFGRGRVLPLEDDHRMVRVQFEGKDEPVNLAPSFAKLTRVSEEPVCKMVVDGKECGKPAQFRAGVPTANGPVTIPVCEEHCPGIYLSRIIESH